MKGVVTAKNLGWKSEKSTKPARTIDCWLSRCFSILGPPLNTVDNRSRHNVLKNLIELDRIANFENLIGSNLIGSQISKTWSDRTWTDRKFWKPDRIELERIANFENLIGSNLIGSQIFKTWSDRTWSDWRFQKPDRIGG